MRRTYTRLTCCALALCWFALAGCASIQKRERVTTEETSEPLPLRRLERLPEAERREGHIDLSGVARCEERWKVTVTTTTATERTAHRLWLDGLPFAAGLLAGAAADLAHTPRRDSDDGGVTGICLGPCLTVGAALGALVSLTSLGVDGLAQLDTAAVDAKVATQTRTRRCDDERRPLTMTPVTLVLQDGTRLRATTDGAGQLLLAPALVDAVRSVEVDGHSATVTTKARTP